jgi:hypothetical protein
VKTSASGSVSANAKSLSGTPDGEHFGDTEKSDTMASGKTSVAITKDDTGTLGFADGEAVIGSASAADVFNSGGPFADDVSIGASFVGTASMANGGGLLPFSYGMKVVSSADGKTSQSASNDEDFVVDGDEFEDIFTESETSASGAAKTTVDADYADALAVAGTGSISSAGFLNDVLGSSGASVTGTFVSGEGLDLDAEATLKSAKTTSEAEFESGGFSILPVPFESEIETKANAGSSEAEIDIDDGGAALSFATDFGVAASGFEIAGGALSTAASGAIEGGGGIGPDFSGEFKISPIDTSAEAEGPWGNAETQVKGRFDFMHLAQTFEAEAEGPDALETYIFGGIDIIDPNVPFEIIGNNQIAFAISG